MIIKRCNPLLGFLFQALLIVVLFNQISCSGTNSNAETITLIEFIELCTNGKAGQTDLLKVLNIRNPHEVNTAVMYSIKYTIALTAADVYKAVWEGDANRYPVLDMEYLNQPVIRLAVASALATIDPDNRNEYKPYIISQLDSENNEVRKYAVMAIGNAGDEKDMEHLKDTVKLHNGEYLSQAATSMLLIDETSAVAALEVLREEFGIESENGKLITDIIKPYQDADRTHRCGHH
jgi:hypothetical protein